MKIPQDIRERAIDHAIVYSETSADRNLREDGARRAIYMIETLLPSPDAGAADAAQQDPLLLEVLNFIELARSLRIKTGYGDLVDRTTERAELRERADALYKKLDAVKWGVRKADTGAALEALDRIEKNNITMIAIRGYGVASDEDLDTIRQALQPRAEEKGVFLKKGASALIWHPEDRFTFAHAKSPPDEYVPQEVVCLAALMIRLQNPEFREEICVDFEEAKVTPQPRAADGEKS